MDRDLIKTRELCRTYNVKNKKNMDSIPNVNK